MTDRIVFKSVIGSHRLRSKKTPRILFPYYQNYKPVYRGRNSRTPKWCWPDVDKYPYHTHQKRFPAKSDINIEFFAQFCNRSEKNRTLFELLHTLPNYGIKSIVYKKRVKPEADVIMYDKSSFNTKNDLSSTDKDYCRQNKNIGDENEEQTHECRLNINDSTYIISDHVQNNLFYYIKQVKYKIRPFKAKIISDMYYNDKLIKRNITPNGAIRGVWRYSFPITHTENKHLYRPAVQACYGDLIIGH